MAQLSCLRDLDAEGDKSAAAWRRFLDLSIRELSEIGPAARCRGSLDGRDGEVVVMSAPTERQIHASSSSTRSQHLVGEVLTAAARRTRRCPVRIAHRVLSHDLNLYQSSTQSRILCSSATCTASNSRTARPTRCVARGAATEASTARRSKRMRQRLARRGADPQSRLLCSTSRLQPRRCVTIA